MKYSFVMKIWLYVNSFSFLLLNLSATGLSDGSLSYISAGSMFWSTWGLAEQSFITMMYLHSMWSMTYDSNSVPETDWLIFSWLFYGASHDSAWTGVNTHSLQARQKHSCSSADGQKRHKFIKIKSSWTLDFTTGDWLFSWCVHHLSSQHSSKKSSYSWKSSILDTVNVTQETTAGNSLPAVFRTI